MGRKVEKYREASIFIFTYWRIKRWETELNSKCIMSC